MALPAQAGADWISGSGRLSFGVTDRVPDADLYLFGDATLRFAPPSARWGIELGLFGYDNAQDTPHETYATVTWDTGTLRVSAGVPRAAYDSFAVSAFDGSFPTFSVDQAPLTRSVATWGPLFAGHVPYGVRLDAQTTDLTFAASIHHAGSVDITTASVGMAYALGAVTLAAGVEGSFGATDTVSGKFQAFWSNGNVEAGLGLYAPGAAGLEETAELFATVSPSDRLSVTGIVQAPLSGGTTTGGVSGRYAINDRFNVSVGALGVTGNDPTYNASIGFNF